ncbi:hypothetical protein [Epilithonimonas zeae]|uniref:hypothetical protein n=1 Tax=Epilithonimonas zeae TaxID=1416779 RepID=UPI002010856D|nr:hypothetical protein [Epilithonimonas zeae]UQB69670.1 hypothetical protein KI430_04375 [Epilithonimonas zeae]
MKNIPIANILGVIISIGVLLSVPQIVNWVFQNHFENNILPYSPRAEFEMYFDESRISFDKNFMFGIWILILVMFVYLIFLDFRLKSVNESRLPNRKLQLSIFMKRIIAYIIIFLALPMNLLVFDKGSSSEMLSLSDKMILSSFILMMFNSVSLLPYLSQRNIATFFKLKDVLIFNVGMIICMTLLFYLGVSQYVAPAISGILSGFAFVKKMTETWNHIENYFDIKGKRFHEMM